MPYSKTEEGRAATRAAAKRHYDANPDYYRDKNAKRRNRVRGLLREYKETHPCTDCGGYFPYYVMEFDHLRDKVSPIARMAGGRTWNVILAEIAKCDLVCANCHSIRTYQRRHDLDVV